MCIRDRGIPALPLTVQQTADVIELLKAPPAGEAEFLLDLLVNRVPAGVDDAAKVKASYLAAVAFGSETNALITRARATELLGTMPVSYTHLDVYKRQIANRGAVGQRQMLQTIAIKFDELAYNAMFAQHLGDG